MLEEEIARDIANVIDWAISRSQIDGETVQADRFRILKQYLSSDSNATEILTAADLGRRGGLSKSDAKVQAARENALKGGGIGRCYASGKSANKKEAKYLYFDDKKERDRWVNQAPPGIVRLAVPAVDAGVRRARKQNELIDGDKILAEQESSAELFDELERYHQLD